MANRSGIRFPDSIYQRDRALEQKYGIDDLKIYGFHERERSVHILVETLAQAGIAKDFCLICTLYDSDGDILETKQSDSYGSGVVTSMIKKEIFFTGFPATFSFFTPVSEISKIHIVPADSY